MRGESWLAIKDSLLDLKTRHSSFLNDSCFVPAFYFFYLGAAGFGAAP